MSKKDIWLMVWKFHELSLEVSSNPMWNSKYTFERGMISFDEDNEMFSVEMKYEYILPNIYAGVHFGDFIVRHTE